MSFHELSPVIGNQSVKIMLKDHVMLFKFLPTGELSVYIPRYHRETLFVIGQFLTPMFVSTQNFVMKHEEHSNTCI